ncbi:hypothetical protein C2869_16930 [Saccharobesus litoralis]|uniref:Mce/MlaD domain-containing protein n=1 Tax=Saccharobesus litoralis TaxID=2172099 RepID=A0A2S0VUV6_9ALTE|nr:hypothetical protein [Saccharobesus litoralis]AWB68004.1 hypothetical protein C2869_16930 [Saccharobesus litoralis]
MRPSNRVVNLFILTGISLFVALFVAVSIKSKVFSQKIYYYTEMADAFGLVGEPLLTFKGVDIGRFTEFDFDQQNNIKAKFFVYEKYQHLVTHGSVLVRNQNVLLTDVATFKLLQTQSNTGLIEANQLVPFHTSPLGRVYLAQSEQALETDKLAALLADIKLLVGELRVGNNETTVGLPQMITQLTHVLAESKQFITQLNQQNTIENLNQTIGQAQAVMNQLSASVTKVDSTLTSVDQLLAVYQQPNKIIEQATGGKLPEVLESAEQNLQYVEGILQQVHAERQHIGLLMLQSNKALQELNKTLKAVKSNPLLKSAFPVESFEPQIEVSQ